MTTPEAGVGSSEQAVEPQRIEVDSHSIPSFNGENVPEVRDAFTANLNLVKGGDVVSTKGETIRTDGILGSAKVKIDARLEQINMTSQALAEDREQFGKGRFRGPRAVRELEQESRRTSQADNRVLSESVRNVREQQKRIEKLCKEKHISQEQRVSYNDMIAVEEYLTNNSSADLQPVRQNLEALKWTRRPLTRERIEDLLDGAQTLAQGYEEYKNLRIGQGEGDNRIKGLRDFDADVQAAEERRNTRVADVKSRLKAVKDKARDWEQRNAEFRAQDTPEQRKLKISHALITKIEEYLEPHYIPDADRLTKIGTDLIGTKGNLENIKESLAGIARAAGGKIGKKFESGRDSREVVSSLEKKIADLEKEQQELADPVKRLTQDGAPRELKAMVKKVQDRNFDINRIAPQERILAETVLALLGKGTVMVEKQAEEEVIIAAGDVPEVVGPPEEEIATIEATTAALPTTGETSAQNMNTLANQAMEGALTAEMLQNLPQNLEAQSINNALIAPEYFSTLKDDLKASLTSAESGKSGISRDDLSLLIVDALRRVANNINLATAAPFMFTADFNSIKEYVNWLSTERQNSEDQAKINETIRLLTVAETAYIFKNSG